MSKGQNLRALVTERLTAAAEDILLLFERTMAEFEEELCLYKNQRSLRDTALCQSVQMSSLSPGLVLNQEITETPQIKEDPKEQSIKQEEEQLPVSVPESTAVCVKTEESSLLQQGQTEYQTQGEDISSEPHFHSETEHSSDTVNDDHLEPISCSSAQMETEAEGDRYSQVQTRNRTTAVQNSTLSAPETSASVHNEHLSRADDAQEKKKQKKKHQCSLCKKRFRTKQHLQDHIRIHTGEKPYSCSICNKTFTQKSALTVHTTIHTGIKPYSCSVCHKTFAHKGLLATHMRCHTGERPFSCTVCSKTFVQNSHLKAHMRSHTGMRPYSCSICPKAFILKSHLTAHMGTHIMVLGDVL